MDVDVVSANRVKSKMTKGTAKTLHITLNPLAKSIINKWGTFPRDPNKYIFGFYKNDMSTEDKERGKKNVIKNVNNWMKEHTKSLSIEMDVTSYHARHSFAQLLRNSKYNIEYIQEALAHSDKKSTENYISSLSQDKGVEIQENLLKALGLNSF